MLIVKPSPKQKWRYTTVFRLKRLVLPVSLVILAGTLAVAVGKGNDVRFFATVVRIDLTSPTQGAITLRVMALEVPVRITNDTEFEAHGDSVGLSGLQTGDFVKVSGFFVNSAIVAREIEVIDRGSGEFRLRGPITAVRLSASGTIVTVLGVDVLVDTNTRIERRGSDSGFTAADLTAGLFVDTQGTTREGQFLATRVKAGNREEDAIRVEFSGRLTGVDPSRLAVDTEGGSTAVVLITTSTTVIGTPAVGQFAEVRGTLNQQLEVVASLIQIKTSRESDDDENPPTAGTAFEKKITLIPATGVTTRGNAEIEVERHDGEVRQQMEVEIEKGPASTPLLIRVEVSSVGIVDFGTLLTNHEGEAEVRFTTNPHEDRRDLRPLLPAGKTVRDFVRIQILNPAGAVLLEGRF